MSIEVTIPDLPLADSPIPQSALLEISNSGVSEKATIAQIVASGQTPWTQDIQAANFQLLDASNVQTDQLEIINPGGGSNPTLTSNSAVDVLEFSGDIQIDGSSLIFGNHVLEDGWSMSGDTDTLLLTPPPISGFGTRTFEIITVNPGGSYTINFNIDTGNTELTWYTIAQGVTTSEAAIRHIAEVSASDDSGTEPITSYVSRRIGQTDIETRDLFTWWNHETIVLSINEAGIVNFPVSPNISDFTNSLHDHSDDINGGQISLTAIALLSAQIIVGNVSGDAAAVSMSGDATIDNTGDLTIEDDAVTLAKIATGTAGGLIGYDVSGDPTDVAAGTLGQILTSNGTGLATFEDASVSGIVTINGDGTSAQNMLAGTGLGINNSGANHTYSITSGVHSEITGLGNQTQSLNMDGNNISDMFVITMKNAYTFTSTGPSLTINVNATKFLNLSLAGTAILSINPNGGIDVTQSFSYTDGLKQTFNPNATNAGLNVGAIAGNPTSQSNGDIWYDSATNTMFGRIGGSNVDLGSTGAEALPDLTDVTITSRAANQVLVVNSGNTLWVNSLLANANISGSAAIAYSKLNLSNSVVNGDLATGVFSKITGLGSQTQNLNMDGNNMSDMFSITFKNSYTLVSTGPSFRINVGSTKLFELSQNGTPYFTATAAGGLDITRAFTYTDGLKQTFNPNATNAGINVGAQVNPDPTSPVNGDIYYNSTNNKFRVREGAAWVDMITAAGGQVDSVVGTSNRISIDSADPVNPIVDIDSAYVGQTSITTLGVITTGTWNGTAITGANINAALTDLSDVTAKTGTGTTVVMNTSPTLVTPALGTPTALVLSNATALPVSGLADGTPGELITWDGSNNADVVDVGTATHVLTSNGAGNPPTFQVTAEITTWTEDHNAGDFNLDNLKGITDSALNELITFAEVASAVNEFTITNAANPNGPILSATGGDTDIPMNLSSKGAGDLNFQINLVNALIIDESATQINAVDSFVFAEAGVPISPIGMQTFFVSARDMYPSSTAGTTEELLETTTNGNTYPSQTFPDNATRSCQWTWSPPETWDAGVVSVELYWTSPDGTVVTGTVRFTIAAVSYASDDPLDAAFGTAVVVTQDLGSAQEDMMLTDNSADITIAGVPAKDDLIIFKILRDPADAADDLGGEANLIGMHIHYITDAATVT